MHSLVRGRDKELYDGANCISKVEISKDYFLEPFGDTYDTQLAQL
jgi:hypothetical protein